MGNIKLCNKFSNFLNKADEFITDTLFPVRCIGCGFYGDWICKNCFSSIRYNKDQICPICEKVKTPDARTCINCKRKSPLDGMLICADYKQPIVSKAIHLYKYKFIKELCLPFGKIMNNALLESEYPIADLIIPVPLHKRRLRWRGFNQSKLLAEYMGQNLVPLLKIKTADHIITRTRYTKPQMKLKDHFQRKDNIKNAFEIKNKSLVDGKIIFLIDDVATTGSTINECAKMLKKSGAKEVFAIVLARQS